MPSPRETTKDVSVGGKPYQIRKMSARTASWICMQIMTRMLPASMEDKLGLSLPSERSQMSEAEFHNIQDHCLECCYRYQQIGEVNTPMPIFTRGQFSFPDLEDDLMSVMALTVHVLMFNATPFFEENAFKEMLQAFPGLIPVDALK